MPGPSLAACDRLLEPLVLRFTGAAPQRWTSRQTVAAVSPAVVTPACRGAAAASLGRRLYSYLCIPRRIRAGRGDNSAHSLLSDTVTPAASDVSQRLPVRNRSDSELVMQW